VGRVHLDSNNQSRAHPTSQSPVAEPVLFGFYYRPASTRSRTFVLAGAGEVKSMRGNDLGNRRGRDVSASGLTQKTKFVMDLLGTPFRNMKMTWGRCDGGESLYRARCASTVIASTILPAISSCASRNHLALLAPADHCVELEIDADCVARSLAAGKPRESGCDGCASTVTRP
jgi:hypothetical protein